MKLENTKLSEFHFHVPVFLHNLIINLIVKGNVQFICLCNPQTSSVNAFLMRNIKGTLMQI